jgi:hypothetical protein
MNTTVTSWSGDDGSKGWWRLWGVENAVWKPLSWPVRSMGDDGQSGGDFVLGLGVDE